jgi:ribonucleoside-diphosphate reductase alpha chain
MEEAIALYRSYSGERGIFNREAAQHCSEEIGRDGNQYFGTNPCGEITLRPMQFCNLTEVIMRSTDTQDDLIRKVQAATIIGCIQASCTNFPYLRKAWQNNTQEEALLGVSLTGMADGKWGPSTLNRLRGWANQTAELWAGYLGINKPAAVTTVKPSGTVSILVDSSSGIHERWGQFYMRRVRMDRKDPLCQLMIDQGVPGEPEVNNPSNTWVFEFPVGVDREVTPPTAAHQLDVWAMVKTHYTDHNPSVTISYNEDEFMDIMNTLYNEHWDIAQGLSFLPKQDAVYKQAPLEVLSEEAYLKAVAAMPKLDWSKLGEYETTDGTSSSQTMACSGGSCEIADGI